MSILSSDTAEIHPIMAEWTFYHTKSNFTDFEVLNNKVMDNKLLDRDNIRVLTYNIFLRPPLAKNNENDWKDDRLEDFLKLLHNYDVICLQEIFGAYNSRKNKLIRAATKNGLFFYVEQNAPSFYSRYIADGGLLILSRFPIVNYSVYFFNYGVLSDSLAQKGALYAQIEIGGGLLHLFNTHTQASYINDLHDLFEASYSTRMDQIKQLADFISDVLNKHYDSSKDLALLCGDMNIDALKYHRSRIVSLILNFCSQIQSSSVLFKMNTQNFSKYYIKQE